MDGKAYENKGDDKQVYGDVVLTLDNCLLDEERLNSPPSLLDGLDAETENDLRIFGCELIQTAGILLRLPQVAMATGQVLFQRFYYCKSFVRHPMDITAMGCLCLASKIEEAPRRIRDVINVFHHIRQVRAQKPITPLILDHHYITLKTQVIKAERRVLKELGFCVHVKHPHKLIICYLQVITVEKNSNLMQTAWNYMNDSLRTDVFLRHTPETVACACIYLAARKIKLVLLDEWFHIFQVNEDDIKDTCRRIMKVYQRTKMDQETLEAKVEVLKKRYEECRKKGNVPSVPVTEHAIPAKNIVEKDSTAETNSMEKQHGRKRGSEEVALKSSEEKHQRKRSHKRKSRSTSRSPSLSPRHRKSKKYGRKYSRSRSLERRKSGKKSQHKSRYESLTPSPERYTKKSKHKSYHVDNPIIRSFASYFKGKSRSDDKKQEKKSSKAHKDEDDDYRKRRKKNT